MKKMFFALSTVGLLTACSKTDFRDPSAKQNSEDISLAKMPFSGFTHTGSIQLGPTANPTGAAEISAYDPLTKKLFVVNNSDYSRIDVVDLSNPVAPAKTGEILMAPFDGSANSVAVSNGRLAAAIEASTKTSPGKVVVFNTSTLDVIASTEVGALPDMVCFSPNGRFILTANEGEPNNSYTVDPVGTVSIIDTETGYQETRLDFAGFAGMRAELEARGLRIYGPNASFAQDIEPEYVAVSANSETAWVTLQENNAISRIDLLTKTITNIFPLGFKDHLLGANRMDASDQDGLGGAQLKGNFQNWPVRGMYQPDAIAVAVQGNVPFIYSANEGDARDYSGYSEQRRLGSSSHILDATVFPNAATLKQAANLGRLNITRATGNFDGDSDYDAIYAYGARSFSIWHGENGQQIYDSGNEVDSITFKNNAYDDGRSDDKGAEPEGIAVGRIGNSSFLFVGLERADAVMVFELSNPRRPRFVQFLPCGDAPEGVAFVEADKSPNGKPLLIVSSENDGQVKIFSAN
jgi:hypothetical protein